MKERLTPDNPFFRVMVLFPGLIPVTLTFWSVIGVALLAQVAGYLYRRVMLRYLPKTAQNPEKG